MPSNMHLISTPWEPRALAALIERYEAALPRRRVAELGARQPRPLAASRPASARRRRASRRCCCSRCAARRRSTTATSWACTDVAIPPERVQDPWEEAGRDPARTPMQWSAAAAASRPGSRGCRWATPRMNVEAQREDPRSMLHPAPRADRAAARLRGRAVRDVAVDDATLVYRRGPFRGRLEPLRRARRAARRAASGSAPARRRRRRAARRTKASCSARDAAGSTAAPRRRSSKCRCGPVERPVEPTRPIGAPAATHCPRRTSMRDRCAYQLVIPEPWRRTTSLP